MYLCKELMKVNIYNLRCLFSQRDAQICHGHRDANIFVKMGIQMPIFGDAYFHLTPGGRQENKRKNHKTAYRSTNT